MEQKVPRLVLAGTNSGCGKTTVTCAVLQALVSRGLRVGAAKCGPDYIDPMFHSRIIGAKSSNLDAFFFDPDTLRYLLARNARFTMPWARGPRCAPVSPAIRHERRWTPSWKRSRGWPWRGRRESHGNEN